MDNVFIYAVILVIMGALGWLRSRQEQKEAQRRLDEPKTSADDLPEATRRQLYGDRGQPIREARPARRQSQSSAPPAIPTARPRQQQPARPAHPPRRRQEQPARRTAAPAQRRQAPPRRQSQSQPAPKEPALPPAMQRMRSALEQMAENMQQQLGEPEMRPAPPPRRRPTKSAQQLAAEQQAKRKEQIRQQRQTEEAARARRQRQFQAAAARKPSKHLLGNINEIRRGIVLAEVLGTPKGLQF